MTNAPFQDIREFQDIETLNAYRDLSRRFPGETEKIMRAIRAKSRDNARTPMQWDNTKNAGFSNSDPWLAVNPNYHEINAVQNKADPDSVFHFYQNMILLRKQHPGLIYGTYLPLLEEDEQIFAYLRKYEAHTYLILLNFSGEAVSVKLPPEIGAAGAALLISNDSSKSGSALAKDPELKPYESDVYLLH